MVSFDNDNPLWRACAEAEQTAAHIILECKVTTDWVKNLRSPGTLTKVIGNNNFQELGWQKRHPILQYGRTIDVKLRK